jgi:hypothetical protein
MPRGASVPTLTPHHSGTVQPRKGGPLWLQHQAYGYLLTLCQDHARVSATAVLVATRTGFPRRAGGRPVSVFLTDGAARGGDQEGCQGRAQPGLHIRVMRARVWA